MPFITTKSPLWLEMLDATDYDLYHLPGYAELDANMLGGEPIGWYYEGDGLKCLIPLIKRVVPQAYNAKHSFLGKLKIYEVMDDSSPLYDIVSPYGYPGVLCNRKFGEKKAAKVLDVFQEEAIFEGLVSGFIRLNPFLNNWNPDTLGVDASTYGYTAALDVKDSVRSTFCENHRRDLKQLHAKGYSTSVNEWEHLQAFMDAYHETMRRRNAQQYYHFPVAYFRRLREIAGEHLMLVSVLSPEGKFVSGALYTHFHGVMQFHLGGTSNGALQLSPSKLAMEKAIETGRQLNAKWLHLGGGVGADTSDGLFRFKQGFAGHGHKLPFTCLRFIHHHEHYRSLCVNEGNGFFPGYRSIP